MLAVIDNAAVGLTEWPLGSGTSIAPNSVIFKYSYGARPASLLPVMTALFMR